MKNQIQLTSFYDASIEEVWEALTDQKALSEWLMPCNFEPRVGHKFEFRTKSSPLFDGIVHCVVLELRDREFLSFSWSGGPVKNTVVSFQLSEANNQTRLDFEHTGFEGFLSNVLVRRILASGWKKKILTVLLPQYLAK